MTPEVITELEWTDGIHYPISLIGVYDAPEGCEFDPA